MKVEKMGIPENPEIAIMHQEEMIEALRVQVKHLKECYEIQKLAAHTAIDAGNDLRVKLDIAVKCLNETFGALNPYDKDGNENPAVTRIHEALAQIQVGSEVEK